jgi:hypothetical protein
LTRASSIVRRRGKSSALARGSRAQSVKGDAVKPDPNLRKTGIRVMADMPWGTHICVFYQTKQDLLDTAVSYFEAGLKNSPCPGWVGVFAKSSL